jgi:hypothetical protein
MRKFTVTLVKTYEIEVEAESREDAEDIALEIPLEQWGDYYDVEITIEGE